MIEFGGYITAEDAERIRKVQVIAMKYEDDDDRLEEEEFMTPSELVKYRQSKKIADNGDWPELIDGDAPETLSDVGVDVVEKVVEDANKDDDKLGRNRHRSGAPNKPTKKEFVEDDLDEEDPGLFENNSELKAVVKIYYYPTTTATIPFWVYSERLNPAKTRYTSEYVMTIFDADTISDSDD